MITKEIEDGPEFWLPSDFLTDDFCASSEEKPAENEGDKETLQLIMRHSFHGDTRSPKPSIMATSPQSTLCGIGRWSFNSNGSPDGNSLVSSPPSTPFQKPKDGALDLLYAAAGQVERLSLNNNGSSPSVPIKNQRMHLFSDQDLIQQQLQAARFYQLKRQQLLKLQQQQLNAVWGRQQQQQQLNRATNPAKATPLGLYNLAWPPLQKQSQQKAPPQRGSGMTAVFLNGGRRQSAGTGVFLPRRSGATPAEPRKKSTCSTVLLPARVVQALNLNLEDMEVHPRAPNCYVLDRDVMKSNMKRNQAAAVGASQELRLPQEWTY